MYEGNLSNTAFEIFVVMLCVLTDHITSKAVLKTVFHNLCPFLSTLLYIVSAAIAQQAKHSIIQI